MQPFPAYRAVFSRKRMDGINATFANWKAGNFEERGATDSAIVREEGEKDGRSRALG